MAEEGAQQDDEADSGLPVFGVEQRALILRGLLIKLLRSERYGDLCLHEPQVEAQKRVGVEAVALLLVFAWPMTAAVGSALHPSGAAWLALAAASVVVALLMIAGFGKAVSESGAMEGPVAVAVGVAYLGGAAAAAATGSWTRLWWWYGVPWVLVLVLVALRRLRLGTLRDFAATAGSIAKSSPLLAPVALVVLFVPLFSQDLWQAAADLQVADGILLFGGTVGVMAVLLMMSLGSATEAVVRTRAVRLETHVDPLSALTAETARVDGQESAVMIEQLAREAADAFRAPTPSEYAPYIAVTVRRSLVLQLVARLLATVVAAAAILSAYFYLLATLALERSQVTSWSGVRSVPSTTILGMPLPGGPYLQVAALLGMAATAIFLAFALTEERFSEQLADALLHRPVDRCLVVAVPYVWLDESLFVESDAARRASRQLS